jgi:hypothetical protein
MTKTRVEVVTSVERPTVIECGERTDPRSRRGVGGDCSFDQHATVT